MLFLTIFIHSLIIGFMIFFMSIVTPTVFKSLDEQQAGKFLRIIFPRMFIYGFILSLLASLSALFAELSMYWSLSLITAFLFLINAYIITPRINTYRDLQLSGNENAVKMFKALHFFSVLIFIIQLLISIFLIISYL